ncbi:MAG: tRNA uridine-5-carboxymethylaminomethyl(34) synthesis GTPase MnmE [Alphaproteobacteria bacterium]
MTTRPDTIFALSSGAGKAGVAVVRVSGPDACAVLHALTGRSEWPTRVACRARLVDPSTDDVLDDALALYFPAPNSYTGEDVVELHVHGGRAVIAGVLAALGRIEGVSPAEPGEFTRRAFLNGKFDLTAAEGIADLIDAETEAQRRQAVRQAEGALGRLYDAWRTRLIRILAFWEAHIDFPDEDLPAEIVDQTRAEIQPLIESIEAQLRDGQRGERLRDGFSVAIVGAPNVGKSSLLNALARREAAIVSSIAGTTRDIVEVYLDLAGYPVILADTAGLRDLQSVGQADPIEAEGIRRALERAAAADLKLVVFAADADLESTTLDLVDERSLVVVNKSDRGAVDAAKFPVGTKIYRVSARTGDGIETLTRALVERVGTQLEVGEAPVMTRARHRAALEDCVESLRAALRAEQLELAAEDLRLAARALGRISGRVDVEDLLDVIFYQFCIGK